MKDVAQVRGSTVILTSGPQMGEMISKFLPWTLGSAHVKSCNSFSFNLVRAAQPFNRSLEIAETSLVSRKMPGWKKKHAPEKNIEISFTNFFKESEANTLLASY